MKLEEYKNFTLRTNKFLSSTQFDVAHMLLGMTSEINELDAALISKDEVNIAEELADIMWYVSNYSHLRLCNIVEPTNKPEYIVTPLLYDNLVYNISLLTDLAKKWIIYNKVIDEETEEKYLQQVVNNVYAFGVDMERALQNNIDKLKKRYPDKYSDEYAQNRDLEAERKELEK